MEKEFLNLIINEIDELGELPLQLIIPYMNRFHRNGKIERHHEEELDYSVDSKSLLDLKETIISLVRTNKVELFQYHEDSQSQGPRWEDVFIRIDGEIVISILEDDANWHLQQISNKKAYFLA